MLPARAAGPRMRFAPPVPVAAFRQAALSSGLLLGARTSTRSGRELDPPGRCITPRALRRTCGSCAMRTTRLAIRGWTSTPPPPSASPAIAYLWIRRPGLWSGHCDAHHDALSGWQRQWRSEQRGSESAVPRHNTSARMPATRSPSRWPRGSPERFKKRPNLESVVTAAPHKGGVRCSRRHRHRRPPGGSPESQHALGVAIQVAHQGDASLGLIAVARDEALGPYWTRPPVSCPQTSR